MGGVMTKAELISFVNKNMMVASDAAEADAERVAALRRLDAICHRRDSIEHVQERLGEVQHVSGLLNLMLARNPGVSGAAFQLVYTITTTHDADIKVTFGNKMMEDLLQLLQTHATMPQAKLETLLLVIANLLTEDSCRTEILQATLKGKGGIKELVTALNHEVPKVQLASLRVLTALAERVQGRRAILKENVLPVIGLCFVDVLYGQTRYYAVRLLTLLSKEDEMRRIIGPRGVLFQLTEAVLKRPRSDPLLTQLVASLYANFSVHDDLVSLDAADTITMLYSLIFADELDHVVQGLWALANCVRVSSLRREFIDTDGLKVIFSLLHFASNETQAWYEVARCIATIAAGGSDEEREYLIHEGSLEVLVAICKWCSADDLKDTDGAREDADKVDDNSRQLFSQTGEDITYAARYLCLTVCMKALRYLTVLGYVCPLLCNLSGTRLVMHVLRADFDTEGQQHASAVVANLALHPVSCRQIVVEDDVVGSLVDLLRFSKHSAVFAEAALALANIGRMNAAYIKYVIDSNGTSALIRVLEMKSCTMTTALNAIKALGMLNTNEAKFQILQGGGLPLLIHFASMNDHVELQRVCATALRSLAELNDDSHQLVMVKDGVLVSLIAMLFIEDAIILRESAKAISILTGRLKSNKIAFVQQNGLLAAAHHLSSTDKDLLSHILTIIGNISSIEGAIHNLPQCNAIIRQLCYVLQLDAFTLTLQAMRCLAALTNTLANSTTVLTILPVSVFVDMTRSHNSTLQRHAVGVLSNLADFEKHWKVLRDSDLMHVLEDLFTSDSFDVVAMAVECLGRLALDPRCEGVRTRVVGGGTISVFRHLADIAKQAEAVSDAESKGTALLSFVATRNNHMLEVVLTALQRLAETEEGAATLLSPAECDCLELFMKSLANNQIGIRCEAAGCLSKCSNYPTLCQRMVRNGCVDLLVQTLRTSAMITDDVEERLQKSHKELEDDMELKLNSPDDLVGITYAERERVMEYMDQQIQMRQQNTRLQVECLKFLYNVVQDVDVQREILETYDWGVFLAPLGVPEMELQITAARLCFKLLEAGEKTHRFVDLKGVRHLLRALEINDSTLRDHAAKGLSVLSSADPAAFRRAVVDEGGVGTMLELLRSDEAQVRAQTFEAISQLCTHAEIGEIFVSQGLLLPLQTQSIRERTNVAAQLTIVRILAALVANEAIRSKVLESGGASILLLSLVHPSSAVARLGSGTLVSLLSPNMDVRECLLRSKTVSNVTKCLTTSDDEKTVAHVLQVFAFLCEKMVYRTREATPEFVLQLLEYAEDEGRDKMLQRRKRQIGDDGYTIGDIGLTSPKAADGTNPTGTGGGGKKRKGHSAVGDEVATNALRCLLSLIHVPHISECLTTESSLGTLMKACDKRSAPARILACAEVVQQLLVQHHNIHEPITAMGLFEKLAALTSCTDQDVRLRLAVCMQIVAEQTPTVLTVFEKDPICEGFKTLSACTTVELQAACCKIVEHVVQHDLNLLNFDIVHDLLKFAAAANEDVRVDALAVIRSVCPEYEKWFEKGGASATQAREHLFPAVPALVDVYRTCLQRSRLAPMALYTLNKVVGTSPVEICPLLDFPMVLDLKKAMLHKGTVTATPLVPIYGQSNINSNDYVQNRSLWKDLNLADTRIHAACVLCHLSAIPFDANDKECPMVKLLKALTLDDMIKKAHQELTDGGDTRLAVLLLRMAANCIQRPTQRHQVTEDKSGLPRLLYTLTTHSSPYVVQPALFVLAAVAQDPLTHQRLIGMVGLRVLTATMRSFVETLVTVNTIANGGVKNFTSPETMPISKLLNDLARMISNIADGSAAALRSLKEAEEGLHALLRELPPQAPFDIRAHVLSALGSLDSTHPEMAPGTSMTTAECMEACRDRVDAANILKGAVGLCFLCKDARNHEELQEAGGVAMLCHMLRNPVPKVFAAACWGLIHLAAGGSRDAHHEATQDLPLKERIRLKDQRAATVEAIAGAVAVEGIGPAVKMSQSEQNPELQRVAAKLVTVMLRYPEGRQHVKMQHAGHLVSNPIHPVAV